MIYFVDCGLAIQKYFVRQFSYSCHQIYFSSLICLVYPLFCIVEQEYGKLVVIFGQKAIRVVSLQESATQSGSYR